MIHQIIQRSQAYCFFSHALLYPQENWITDICLLEDILRELNVLNNSESENYLTDLTLESLQRHYRDIFGLTGSLVYETELGLPHEFRQSQELADIAGFYQAFGFRIGAAVRERPDHLATELEFMYVLTLKEAYAIENELIDQVEICVDAQRKFLKDHLARWVSQFCSSMERSTTERLGKAGLDSPYMRIAQLLEHFISFEVSRLGIEATKPLDIEQKLTPYNPDYTCAGCAIAETNL